MKKQKLLLSIIISERYQKPFNCFAHLLIFSPEENFGEQTK